MQYPVPEKYWGRNPRENKNKRTSKQLMTYSSTLALGRQQNLSRGQNSVSFRVADKRLGPVSNTIILIVLTCLLGLLYLTQVTRTNSYGYQINSLEQQQSKLQQQHQDLTVASAREQSVDRAATSTAAQSMTPVAPSGSVQ
jgi:hypothetical protein